MFELIGKNLWILLTVIIPGFFTYGLWRLLLILEPSSILNNEQFKNIDESGLITISIITAVGLLQQIVGIFIELLLSLIARLKKNSWKSLYSFFWDRFEYASKGLLSESSTRIIGNCFLSINIFVGIIILMAYFMLFESLTFCHWIPVILMMFLIISILIIFFRINNALSVIKEIKNKNKNIEAK